MGSSGLYSDDEVGYNVNEFYLVRASDTYGKSDESHLQGKPLNDFGKTSDIEVAKTNAKLLATKNRKTYNVYKVTLVGKAEVSEAIWVDTDGQTI